MKRNVAFVVAVLAFAAIALVAASMGTETWGIIIITRESNTTCGEVTRTLGLFTGNDDSPNVICAQTRTFSMLSGSLIAVNEGLLYSQIAFCCVTILLGLMAAVIASYNFCSRPYEAWAGPSGITAYFSCGAGFNLAAVIMFVIMGFVDLNDTVPESCQGVAIPCKEKQHSQESFTFGYSFYLLVAALAPFILGAITVVVTDKNLTKKTKNKLCPGSLEEPEIQEGNDNNIMMF